MQSSLYIPMYLSVSIVAYNSPIVLLRRTLETLVQSAEVALGAGCVTAVSIAVIDNSSDEKCRLQIQEILAEWPQCDGVSLEYKGVDNNCGFGAGHNLALQNVTSDYHLILNPDVELSADALRVGVSRLQADSGIVLLSPKAVADNGRQEFLCKNQPSVAVLLLRAFAPYFMRKWLQRYLQHYEMREPCSTGVACDVLLASGCFMLVRTAALTRINGFNDKYFLYFEDFDLSLRLATQGRLVFDPAMQIVHHGGYAAKKGLRHVGFFIRSGCRFFHEYGWRWI